MYSGGYKEFANIWDLLIKKGTPLAVKEFQKITDIDQFSPEKKIYYQMLKARIAIWEPNNESVVIALKAYNESKEINKKNIELDAGIHLLDRYIDEYQLNEASKLIILLEKLLDELLLKREDILNKQLILMRLKANILTLNGKMEEAEKLIESAFKINEDVQDKVEEYFLYNLLVWIKTPQGKFNEILRIEDKKLEIAKELKSKNLIAWSHDNLSAIHQWMGNYDIALEYIQETIKLRGELLLKPQVMVAKNRLALHYWYTGELEKATEIFDITIPARLKSTSKRHNCYAYSNKSLVDWYKGDLDEAIKSGEMAVKLAGEINDTTHINLFSIFLAAIYFDKGNYDKALELCENSIAEAKKHGENFHIAFANYVMAMVYHVKGNLDLAWEYAHQSLKIRKEMKIIHHIIESLFSLIQIMLDKNDITQAKAYQVDLEKIVNENPRKRFLIINKIAQGMILKASPKPRDWIKAIDVFLEIVNDEVVTYSLTVIALIQLCELLIREFSISGEPEVLLELESYTERLEDIAKKQQVYKLRIEACHIRILTLWLKAQYSIADIDIQKAKELLAKARDMADEEGLILLAEKIIQQQGQINNRIDQWDEFIRKYYEFLKV